jgi:acyl-CoA reductase-like NAD-dependent aldehyde dehydrogenase
MRGSPGDLLLHQEHRSSNKHHLFMQIINPATEQVIRTVEEDDLPLLEKKFASLQAAQPAWAAVQLENRMEVLERFCSLLETEQEMLAVVLTAESGKPLQQSRNELNGARSRIRWMLDHAVQYLSDEWMTVTGGTKEKISYEPLGVVCNISAWNYPYLVGVNVFVPALLAGNTVLYKPSELATLTGLEIERLLRAAGVPDGVFQLAAGGKATGELLLELPFNGYFFTGSHHTGRYIYERVAARMVPCQLEMGGKDPLYVAGDVADIKAVAIGTADGAFYNNGQSCCAVERIYVHESVYDAYLAAFEQEVRSWKIGSPEAEGVYIGPLTRKANLEVLERQVNDAVSKGARLLCGGRRMPGKGYFFEPAVLVEVNHQMEVMKEESFGPVIGIMKVADDQEALRLMRDSRYGLTAAVYSSSQLLAELLLQQIDAGTGYWNCCDRVSAAVPWSGRKDSGFGATLSHQGLRAFTRPRSWHLRMP